MSSALLFLFFQLWCLLFSLSILLSPSVSPFSSPLLLTVPLSRSLMAQSTPTSNGPSWGRTLCFGERTGASEAFQRSLRVECILSFQTWHLLLYFYFLVFVHLFTRMHRLFQTFLINPLTTSLRFKFLPHPISLHLIFQITKYPNISLSSLAEKRWGITWRSEVTKLSWSCTLKLHRNPMAMKKGKALTHILH